MNSNLQTIEEIEPYKFTNKRWCSLIRSFNDGQRPVETTGQRTMSIIFLNTNKHDQCSSDSGILWTIKKDKIQTRYNICDAVALNALLVSPFKDWQNRHRIIVFRITKIEVQKSIIQFTQSKETTCNEFWKQKFNLQGAISSIISCI